MTDKCATETLRLGELFQEMEHDLGWRNIESLPGRLKEVQNMCRVKLDKEVKIAGKVGKIFDEGKGNWVADIESELAEVRSGVLKKLE